MKSLAIGSTACYMLPYVNCFRQIKKVPNSNFVVMLKILSLIAVTVCFQATSVWAQPAMPEILPLREQAELRDRWLLNRLNSIVPSLMEREQIDMWVVIASEYNEDPVIRTMLPATWMARNANCRGNCGLSDCESHCAPHYRGRTLRACHCTRPHNHQRPRMVVPQQNPVARTLRMVSSIG